jgi:DNA polymerase II small subunit/DNA polymerase delta subunit B
MTKRRKVEVAVISDVHLGTYGCHAKELLTYLKRLTQKHLSLMVTSLIYGNLAKAIGQPRA